MQKYSLLFLLTLTLILGPATVNLSTWAQPPIKVETNVHEALFRDHILFQLGVESETEIKEITLFYQVTDQPAVTHVSPDFDTGLQVETQYIWDLTSGGMPPGVEITYWWKISDGEGYTQKTDPQSLVYTDERYDWRVLSSDNLELYWYRGDAEFGQTLLDRAKSTLTTLSQEAGLSVTRQMKVFIYGSHADLLGAIAEGAKEWTGGQAFPDAGVVMIGVSPTNLDWGQRAVAHELSHLVIHQLVDTPLGDLPQWLDEGLAMYTEGELEPSYQRSLDQALQEDEIITVRSLSSSFPSDPNMAHLSYAQSFSLVEFILEEYGRERMAQLLRVFADGAYYDDALQEVIGLDSQGLDSAWREWATVKPPRQISPVPLQPLQQLSPRRFLLRLSGGLCCLGGLLLVVVTGLLVFTRRRRRRGE